VNVTSIVDPPYPIILSDAVYGVRIADDIYTGEQTKVPDPVSVEPPLMYLTTEIVNGAALGGFVKEENENLKLGLKLPVYVADIVTVEVEPIVPMHDIPELEGTVIEQEREVEVSVAGDGMERTK
jgi:hypothetical protein